MKKELRHEHFNRIREIILNPKNNELNISSIGNLIRNFILMFGISPLSNNLELLKLELIKTF